MDMACKLITGDLRPSLESCNPNKIKIHIFDKLNELSTDD